MGGVKWKTGDLRMEFSFAKKINSVCKLYSIRTTIDLMISDYRMDLIICGCPMMYV